MAGALGRAGLGLKPSVAPCTVAPPSESTGRPGVRCAYALVAALCVSVRAMISSFNSIGVANYKAFARPTTIDLAPITLLFGANNSGKSALLRAIPLIADSGDNATLGGFNLNSEAARGCSFRDMICRHTESQSVHVECRGTGFEFELSLRDDGIEPIVESFRYAGGEDRILGQWMAEDAGGYRVGSETLRVEFRGIVPFVGGEALTPGLAKALRDVARSMAWISSVRVRLDRDVLLPRRRPSRMSPDGGDAISFCALDSRVEQWVSDWFLRHFRARLTLQRQSSVLQPALIRDGVSHAVPFPDCGEGLSQVFPVVVAAGMAMTASDRSMFLCFEQPELHLHPDAHNAVAGLLVELASKSNSTCVVETHSEALLLAIQVALLQGELKREDVAVYWVSGHSDGTSTLKRIELGEDASLGPGWPPSVFHSTDEAHGSVLNLRRKQR